MKCPHENHNSKIIICAKVLVGDVTVGTQEDTRPPMNYNNQRLFDTTVDRINNPSVFVKFDKQEYCPEYVIFIKK